MAVLVVLLGILTWGLGEGGTETSILDITDKVLDIPLQNATETHGEEKNVTKARYPRRIGDFPSSIVQAMKKTISLLERPFIKKKRKIISPGLNARQQAVRSPGPSHHPERRYVLAPAICARIPDKQRKLMCPDFKQGSIRPGNIIRPISSSERFRKVRKMVIHNSNKTRGNKALKPNISSKNAFLTKPISIKNKEKHKNLNKHISDKDSYKEGADKDFNKQAVNTNTSKAYNHTSTVKQLIIELHEQIHDVMEHHDKYDAMNDNGTQYQDMAKIERIERDFDTSRNVNTKDNNELKNIIKHPYTGENETRKAKYNQSYQALQFPNENNANKDVFVNFPTVDLRYKNQDKNIKSPVKPDYVVVSSPEDTRLGVPNRNAILITTNKTVTRLNVKEIATVNEELKDEKRNKRQKTWKPIIYKYSPDLNSISHADNSHKKLKPKGDIYLKQSSYFTPNKENLIKINIQNESKTLANKEKKGKNSNKITTSTLEQDILKKPQGIRLGAPNVKKTIFHDNSDHIGSNELNSETVVKQPIVPPFAKVSVVKQYPTTNAFKNNGEIKHIETIIDNLSSPTNNNHIKDLIPSFGTKHATPLILSTQQQQQSLKRSKFHPVPLGGEADICGVSDLGCHEDILELRMVQLQEQMKRLEMKYWGGRSTF